MKWSSAIATSRLVLLLLLVSVPTFEASLIRIENGGYTNILVAIHANVEEDKSVLENLKGLLTNTSAFLYNATRGLAYFREITIAIPENWTSHHSYETVPANQFQHADIRVDQENAYNGPEPFTRHFRDCGQPGEFIQLSPRYLQILSSPTARNSFGIPERRLVHEWAHFRYGVFEEHPIFGNKKYPIYYRDGEEVIPNTCSQEISEAASFTTKDGWKECDPTKVSDNCVMRVYDSAVTATASLMYMSTPLSSITDFCDDSPERKHNRKAVTEQNIKCNYKSTWEVISSNADFQNKRASTTPVDTRPIIRIVQQKSSADRYVLVLDVSGSMKGTPIELLHESASRFIADQAPENISLGIVTFSSSTSIKKQLTRVNSSTRKTLIDSLPRLAEGGTAIGLGLQTGLEVLQGRGNQSIEGSVILLITDGEETDKPFIETVLPSIVQKKVIVKAIAYGEKATAQLANLTSTTGGQAFFFKNIQDKKASTEGLDSAFLEAVTLQSDLAFEPVAIASTSQKMYLEEQTFKVLVDEELGRNTVFSITSSDITMINMELRSPSNRLYTYQSAEYKRDEYLKRIIFRFPKSEVGEWAVTITRISAAGATPVEVAFSSTSEPKDAKNQPVRIQTRLGAENLKPPATLKIYAWVTKNDLPVIGARVLAIVTTPKQKSHTVILRDNGKYPDESKGDGLYTAFFTGYDSVGRYSVTAVVKGRKKVMVKRKRRHAGPKFRRDRRFGKPFRRDRRFASPTSIETETITDEYSEDYDDSDDYDSNDSDVYEVEPIGPFDRTANVGVFSVEAYDENAGDVIPPVRVVDLDVLSAEIAEDGRREATVVWTSPGDDENIGNATYLELRASTDFDSLLMNFNDATEINSSFVLNGTLQPVPGSEVQSVTLTLPISLFHIKDVNGTLLNVSNILYLSLRAGDESNNVGDVSNIATAYFDEKVIKSSSIEEDQPEEYSLHPGIVILLVVLSGALVLVALMLCLRQRRKRYNRVLVVHMKP